MNNSKFWIAFSLIALLSCRAVEADTPFVGNCFEYDFGEMRNCSQVNEGLADSDCPTACHVLVGGGNVHQCSGTFRQLVDSPLNVPSLKEPESSDGHNLLHYEIEYCSFTAECYCEFFTNGYGGGSWECTLDGWESAASGFPFAILAIDLCEDEE